MNFALKFSYEVFQTCFTEHLLVIVSAESKNIIKQVIPAYIWTF